MMKMKKWALVVILSVVSSLAEAEYVKEQEPNDTAATAQNLSAAFSASLNDVIEMETTGTLAQSSASVYAFSGDSTYDYYSFTVGTSATDIPLNTPVVFDIDFAYINGLDTILVLFDTDGTTILKYNDDNPVDGPGDLKADTLNSFLTYTFTSAGTYYVRVSQFSSTQLYGAPLSTGASYQLHIATDPVVVETESPYTVEKEPNDTPATAQNVTSFFANGTRCLVEVDADGTLAASSLSVYGFSGDSTYDYYSFTVGDNATDIPLNTPVVFDIDFAYINGLDTILVLFDTGGTAILKYNDDNPVDGPGDLKADTLNSFLTYTFTSAGTYYVRVSEFSSTQPYGAPLSTDATYHLHISAAPTPTHYVSPDGGNAWPYLSWADAAKSIQFAINVADAGDSIIVSNGTYNLSAEITVDKDLAIMSVNGPNVTVIRSSGSTRCVTLGDHDIVLGGFTIANGQASGNGGGICCDSLTPTVSNCVISGSSASALGGGVYQGTLYGCLLFGNSATLNGGGAYGSTLMNCTISGNSAVGSGGGVSGGILFNSIVYGNSAPSSPNHHDSVFSYSCTTPDPGGTGNITADPQFVNAGADNYRLQATSPCIDTGANGYVVGASDMDGCPRVVNGTVDLGVYEYIYSVDNYDGDPLSNAEEQIADTDPTDSNDCFRVTSLSSDATVFFNSSAERCYTLQYCNNLITGIWRDVPGQSEITGNGSLDSLSGSVPESVVVYSGFVDEVMADAPEAYYCFEESAGATNLTDSSGNGHNSTMLSDVTFGEDGLVDTAAVFSNGLAELDLQLDPSAGDFSIEAVVRFDASNINRTIFHQRNGTGRGRDILYRTGDGYLRSYLGGKATASSNSVPQGEWHHVVMTVETGGTDDTIRFYIDGEADGSGMTDIEAADGDWLFGNEDLIGALDEVAIYTKKLSAERIAEHYTALTASGAAKSMFYRLQVEQP